MNKLALYGGTPVRDTKLNTNFPRARFYDEEEARKVFDVCMAKSPFRYYGIDSLNMVNDFEAAFAKRMGIKNALGVTSGTAALVVALKTAGIGPGDKVILPACTFVATAGAVVCAGAVPVFADVDESLNIDPKKVGDVCDKYTKALITVPLLGNPCQMDEILEECKKHNLIVIEEAINILKACDEHFCNYEEDENAVVLMGSERYPHVESWMKGVHIPIIYGDFFFVEALCKLKGREFFIW